MYDNAQKVVTRVLRAKKRVEDAINSCMDMVTSYVDLSALPEFMLNSTYEEAPFIQLVLLQARAREAQAAREAAAQSNELSRSGSSAPEDPKKPDDENRPKDTNEQIKIDERNAKHIFRKSEGHFSEDTPQNRQLLEDLVNDKINYYGIDRHGNSGYGKTLQDGRQLWAYIRDGKITNGGINQISIAYNPLTGFSSQTKPIQKLS